MNTLTELFCMTGFKNFNSKIITLSQKKDKIKVVHIRDCNTQLVWRAVCTNRGPKKLPPIPMATTSFILFCVSNLPKISNYQNFTYFMPKLDTNISFILPKNYCKLSQRSPWSCPEHSKPRGPYSFHHSI